MSGLAAAVSFLTRVSAGSGGERNLGAAVPWFPVVGALVGLAVGGIYAGAALVVPPLVAAGLAIAGGALLTGALHEDGLADTADALGSGARGAEAIRILRDPRLGAFGVLALVLTVVIRVAALAALSAPMALAVAPAAHALSRAAAIAVLASVPPASDDGLGAAYGRGVPRGPLVAGMLVAALVGVVALGWWVIPATVLVGLGAATVSWMAAQRIGGVTGDVLGAVQQVGEIAVLVVGAGAAGLWWA